MVKLIKKQIMAYGKKSGTPFKMKSPLYGTEDEKKDKPIPYYAASSDRNTLIEQNIRLKKEYDSQNGAGGRVFKTNDQNYYPTSKFNPTKDNKGVTLKKGYSYGEDGTLSQKVVNNPEGNLVSRNQKPEDSGNSLNPFANTGVNGKSKQKAIAQTPKKPLSQEQKDGFKTGGGESNNPKSLFSSMFSGTTNLSKRNTFNQASTTGESNTRSTDPEEYNMNSKGDNPMSGDIYGNSTTNSTLPDKNNERKPLIPLTKKDNARTSKGLGDASSFVPRGGFSSGASSLTGIGDKSNFGKYDDIADGETKSKTVNKPKGTVITATNIPSADNIDKTGGYLANQVKTGGISLGVDTKMGGASDKPTSTSTTSSASETTYKPMSKRDRIIRNQGIRTKNKGERVGNQIERIRGRQARKGATLAKRDIKRNDSVVNKSYDSTIKASQGKTPNNAMSIAETNLNNFEKGLNSPKPAAATTSASSKSKASTPKGNKVMQNQSTKVEKSSLGIDKNYKAPKGTVKNATSGAKPAAKPSTTTKTSNKPVSRNIKLNITKQTAGFIDDSKIKPGAKVAQGGGRISEADKKSTRAFKPNRSKKSLLSTALGK